MATLPSSGQGSDVNSQIAAGARRSLLTSPACKTNLANAAAAADAAGIAALGSTTTKSKQAIAATTAQASALLAAANCMPAKLCFGAVAPVLRSGTLSSYSLTRAAGARCYGVAVPQHWPALWAGGRLLLRHQRTHPSQHR